MKRLMCLVLSLLLLTGCASGTGGAAAPAAEEGDSTARYVEAMDTLMTLTAYGPNRTAALDAAQAEILRLDALLSTGRADSEISVLNQNGTAALSEDSRALVKGALALYEETEGAFDVTVYPLMQLWGFPEKEYHLPTDQELSEALALVGMERLDYDDRTGTLSLGEGQQIDLGGIGKGYTSQRVMEIFRQAGVKSGMVSLGGNVQCLGTKPDGSPWRIGIQAPWEAEGEIAAVLEIADQAVITSGGYERYFVDEDTGETYCHILDPGTGCPVKGDLASVSIVSDDGMLADGLSTSLYLMGLERAQTFWRAHSAQFQAVLIDNEGKVYVTEGLKDIVEVQKGFSVIQEDAEGA